MTHLQSSNKDLVRLLSDKTVALLDELTAEQLKTAYADFNDATRYEWYYTPVKQPGLKLGDMSPRQRDALMRLLETIYSERGYELVQKIIKLEDILKEWEHLNNNVSHFERSPERYWIKIFGQPSSNSASCWGGHFGGHHISLSWTVVGGAISVSPVFIGANPAEIRHGTAKGVRYLAWEEDRARALTMMLTEEQRGQAIVSPVAPHDILTTNVRVVTPDMVPPGIGMGQLVDKQREALLDLLRSYLDRLTPDLAREHWNDLKQEGWDRIGFSWLGALERYQPHYYTIYSPRLVIEYDNTQDGANHIHTVVRDMKRDWGTDLLAAHYKRAHNKKAA